MSLAVFLLLFSLSQSCCVLYAFAASLPFQQSEHSSSLPTNAQENALRQSVDKTTAAMSKFKQTRQEQINNDFKASESETQAVQLDSVNIFKNYEASQLTLHKINRPEGERSFYVFLPSIFNTTEPTSNQRFPLHFTFHGLNDNCQHFAQATGFMEEYEQLHYILVIPCGSEGALGVGWNAGMCCLGEFNSVDDVAFTRDMIDYLTSKYPVDKSMIFASGFSNGAMLTERLACESNHLFKAVASVAGVVALNPGNGEGLSRCDSLFNQHNNNTAISVLNVHGSADNLVPWNGNFLLGFPAIVEDMTRWAKRNGCSAQNIQTLNQPPFSNLLWNHHCYEAEAPEGSVGETEIELVRVEGGGHNWPQSKQFSTTCYIVQFFERQRHKEQQLVEVAAL